MDKDLWIAASGTGQISIFTEKPERNDHFKRWEGEMIGCINMVVCLFESDGFELPALKWKDEPINIRLSLNTVKQDKKE